MAAMKSLEETSKKWATVTPQRSGEFEAGVRNPKRDWATTTAAAEDAYKAGVTKAASEGRFGRGVRSAGNAKWQDGAISKGVVRWGPGVAAGQGNYQAGFSPYHNALSSKTLSPRYAKRDPRNLQRVKDVVDVMIATKQASGS